MAGSLVGVSRRVLEVMVAAWVGLLAEKEGILSLAGRASVAVGRCMVEGEEKAEVCRVEEERVQGRSRGAMGRSWKRTGRMGCVMHRWLKRW
jgi:hypothetical protein